MTPPLQPYPAYHESGVPWLGEIPAHWEVQSLGSFLSRTSLKNRPDLPLLSVVREKGVILRSTMAEKENHNFIPDNLSNYRVVKSGNLVINKMKSWQGSLGVSPYDGVVSPAYFVFECRFENSAFLHRLLRSKPYVGFFAQASDGVRPDQWDLAIGRMKRIPVLVPTSAEQSAIVRFLDDANHRIDRYIRAKRKLIALLNEQKQAIIHRAVTRGLDPNVRFKPSGIPWIGDVPEHWDVKRLKWVTRLQRGYDLAQDKRIKGKIPVVSSGGIIDTHWESRAEGPGVVMGRYGSTDAVFWIECDFWPHNTALFVTNFYSNYRKWCFYLLRTISKADNSSKSAVPGVDRKDLYEIYVPLPPPSEQEVIVQQIEKAIQVYENASARAEREIALIREYRTRLISDVVTGKVDVRAVAQDLPQVIVEAETPVESEEIEPEDTAVEMVEAEE